MWIKSAAETEVIVPLPEIERRQELLMEELARKDPRVRRILETFEQRPPELEMESVEGLAEEEARLVPEELEETELGEFLEQQGSMAADRLSLVIQQFDELIGQGIPATLAYLEVSIENKLSIVECDTFWETLKSRVETLQDMMEMNASEISKHVNEENREVVHRIIAKIKKPSPAKTFLNYKAAKKATKRVMSSAHAMLPTEDIAQLAREASRYITFGELISWSALNDAVDRLDREDRIRQFASKMYNCNIDFNNAEHLPLYQSAKNSVIFVLQCMLERADYEWDPKTTTWKKW